MRVALALFALFALAYGRHRSAAHLREELGEAQSEAQAIMRRFSENLPIQEFQAFWSELMENLGERKGEFMTLWRENEGRLDVTLEDVREQLGDSYPRVKEMYNRFEERLEKTKKLVREMTVKDILDSIQRYVSQYTRNWDSQTAQDKFDAMVAFVRSSYNSIMENSA